MTIRFLHIKRHGLVLCLRGSFCAAAFSCLLESVSLSFEFDPSSVLMVWECRIPSKVPHSLFLTHLFTSPCGACPARPLTIWAEPFSASPLLARVRSAGCSGGLFSSCRRQRLTGFPCCSTLWGGGNRFVTERGTRRRVSALLSSLQSPHLRRRRTKLDKCRSMSSFEALLLFLSAVCTLFRARHFLHVRSQSHNCEP